MSPPNSGEKKSVFKSFRSAFSSKKSSSSRALQPDGAPGAPPPAYSALDTKSSPFADPSPASFAPAPSAPAPAAAGLSPYPQQRQGSGFELSSDDISSASDPYAFLAKFDTMFLIDDSSSMNSEARWEEVKTVLYQVVPICAEHDEDGIDVFFLNNRKAYRGVRDATVVSDIFSTVFPAGMTPTGRRIADLLDPYVADYTAKAALRGPRKTGVKPLNLIVITDGAPTDKPDTAVAKVLARVAGALDGARAPLWQVGVQFFQVGSDRVAKRALDELDDNLAGLVKQRRLRDIVDTCTFDAKDGDTSVLTSEAVLKTVLGAVEKRFDEQTMYDSRN